MSMADKRKKILAAQAPTPQSIHHPAMPARAPIMVLAARAEEPAAPEEQSVPRITVPSPASVAVQEAEPVSSPDPIGRPEDTQGSALSAPPVPLAVARISPSRAAEKVGKVMDRLMRGLQTRGVSRRTIRISIPYSLRLDRDIYGILRAGEGSAASKVLEAFLAVPRDNLDAIAGAAAVVAERRRRPSRGGLGQSGTVTVTLDGPSSETLEVLAKRSRLSCGAYLEGCVLIWAIEKGLLTAEGLEADV